MAALINWICEERSDHIVVIETPRELEPVAGEAIVTQLEVGRHCDSTADVLRAAPRMDLDVICVDELPGDAMDAALQAADTDQLVIATLRAPSSARALELVIDSYPEGDKQRACGLVADTVRAVITQRLVPALNRDGDEEIGMLLAIEVIHVDDQIREMIRSGDLGLIAAHVQSGNSKGSFLLDTALMDLVRSGRITMDAARGHARNPAKFAARERVQ
jgi:twitching motility protein PilT